MPPLKALTKFKQDILKSIDPSGFFPVGQETDNFPVSSYSEGSMEVTDLSNPSPGEGDSGLYIMEGWSYVGCKDTVHPGSYFGG